jgi:hypothetical protein
VITTSIQDGHQAKNRKKGDDILKNSSLMKLLSQSQPNFTEMIQNCVHQSLVLIELLVPVKKVFM